MLASFGAVMIRYSLWPYR